LSTKSIIFVAVKSKAFFLFLFIWCGHLLCLPSQYNPAIPNLLEINFNKDKISDKISFSIQKQNVSTKTLSQRLKKRKQRGLNSSLYYVALKIDTKTNVCDNYTLLFPNLFLHKDNCIKMEGRAPPFRV
jgi:hypothetical protein